ncbi:amphi-Trp domain-containing protein [Halodesulfovibrio aestuarii]|uniref:amphi-Trp domain-containing protein n=1 Tax=Halodesulfovibrio aestuarii TaxID=126333 RepID=UPI00040870FC
MEKKKIHISGKVPSNLAMSHVECFLEGLRNGNVIVEQDEEKIILQPHAEIEMNIEASVKHDKQRLVITLEWDTPEIETEYDEESLHEHPHWHMHSPRHYDEMHHMHQHGQHAVHYPPTRHDEHNFHSHYHCHGKGEYQLCHTHDHAADHHHYHYAQGSHVHGYRGCCEETPHVPHPGCCAAHNYGVDFKSKRGEHGKKW